MITLTVDIAELPAGASLLAPTGITTPHDAVGALVLSGGSIDAVLREPDLALGAVQIRADGGPLRLLYRVQDAPPDARYPEDMFRVRRNRFTLAADDLAEASRAISEKAGGGMAGIAALVAEAEARFDYAHPEKRFNDDTEAVPYLSCGVAPGSCVDINTYLVASLRAAGFEAGYIYGYFFPAGSGGITHDMHCWVVTRHAGEVLEWDIAHHMKARLGKTRPGLNPRPGRRIAIGHSMGHRYDWSGAGDLLKLLAEPIVVEHGADRRIALTARFAPTQGPVRNFGRAVHQE